MKKGRFEAVGTPSGVRLRAARKMAGLSMEELARRLGGIVTKQAIAKYEKGKMRPSPEVLERLSKVLDIPPEIPAEIEALVGNKGDVLRRLEVMEMEAGSAAPQRVATEVRAYRRGLGAGTLFRLFRRGAKDEKGFGESHEPPMKESREMRGYGREAEVLHSLAAETDEVMLRKEAPRVLREVMRDFELGALEPMALDFSSVRFRERTPIGAKLESALRYRIADQMTRLMAVEAMLGTRVVFRSPLEGVTVAARTDVERAAAAVRDKWGLGESPIPNLLGLLEEKGISVCEVRGFEEFDGLSAAFGSRSVIVVNRDFPADRVRFTAAHELAHLLGGLAAGPESPEGLCQEFAAAFLLPKEALARLMTPAGRKVSLAELAEVKESYGISLQAIMRRAHGLGLVTDRQNRRFREIFKEKGWLEAEPVEYRGRERPVRFRRLLNFAVAEDILDLERAAALAGVTPEEFRKDMGEVF
jgi:Zn-dependent peptidase ImmA (M78 family)/transcriptional regulator with XRE-family HTH domain